MSLDTSDWENLRTFLAVLRGGSLSAAARQLAVAQPTVRRRLEALEQASGGALFVRSPAGLVPTEKARALADHAEAMDAAAEAFTRAASSRPGEIEGTVRITASEVVGGEVLPVMLADLQRQQPRLRFEIVLSNQAQDLLRQEADIAVRMVQPSQAALVVKHVGGIRLGLFAAPDYIAARGRPGSVADLAGHTLIGPDRTANEFKAIVDMLGPAAMEAMSYRTDSHLAQINAIRGGVGIGVCQTPLAQQPVRLERVLAPQFDVKLETWLAMHEDLRRVPRIRAVFDHLVKAMAAYCAST